METLRRFGLRVASIILALVALLAGFLTVLGFSQGSGLVPRGARVVWGSMDPLELVVFLTKHRPEVLFLVVFAVSAAGCVFFRLALRGNRCRLLGGIYIATQLFLALWAWTLGAAIVTLPSNDYGQPFLEVVVRDGRDIHALVAPGLAYGSVVAGVVFLLPALIGLFFFGSSPKQ
ncbi:MAG: hypothetical protein R6X33_03410 [Candidatus Brocadiia bacterium]